MRHMAAAFAVFALAGCSSAPPARWVHGGASLDIPHARWTRGDTIVEIEPSGRIRINGDHELTIDRAGRLFEPDATPVALLEPDGRVVGGNDRPLGNVGTMHASPPGRYNAWLTVLPSGEVVRYDAEGDRHRFGAWAGQCNRSLGTRQVCTFVTHVLAMKMRDRLEGGGGVTFGVGVGVGIVR
jgi:hypothetical protein